MKLPFPVRLTYGRARRLNTARNQTEARDILIAALAEDMIAEIEHHLAEVAR